MRNSFADELLSLAEQDDRVVMLSGDIGNRLFDRYKSRFPDRFFNCGVAEANMMGVAAGLAMNHLRPIAYTITPFVTTRCLEQIRVDVCYHHLPVVIAGVGAGLCYAELGATHHACEDIALLRMLPGMTVVCPADPVEARLALRAALSAEGPVYLRLGKKGEPQVHPQPPLFVLGQAIPLREGRDVALLGTGTMVFDTLEVARRLEAQHVQARVLSMHTVKPLDTQQLESAFRDCPLVVTIEEHSVLGGLGGAVAEWRCARPQLPGRLLRIGSPDEFFHEAGSQQHARRRWGLDVDSITRRIQNELCALAPEKGSKTV